MTWLWLIANIIVALACVAVSVAIGVVVWIGVSQLIHDERARRREREWRV